MIRPDYRKAILGTCALPAALEAVGERWSFLILRAAFNGLAHFEEFQSELGIARNILARDDEVDQLKDQVFRVLLTYMMADPATIERALGLILISRNLERIADHATNIAEDVIFVVEAKDVRHHHEERK